MVSGEWRLWTVRARILHCFVATGGESGGEGPAGGEEMGGESSRGAEGGRVGCVAVGEGTGVG